ncbi:MAG: isoprenylcysteine carboxylmethyltransferase family protein [Acidobacteriota bacterium]
MQNAQVENRLTFRRLAQKLRVTLGFVIVPLLFIAARPTLGGLIIGFLISVLGLGIRAWASGFLKKNQELTVSGPYAFTRNPLYLGTFIMAMGIALSTNSLWFIAVFLGLYLLIYIPVMLAEAETLNNLFPADYASYRSRVPMFLPRLTPFRKSPVREGESGFSLQQYKKHREYRAALGVVVVYGLLAVKMVLM